jgi:hypothetical protein
MMIHYISIPIAGIIGYNSTKIYYNNPRCRTFIILFY